MYWGLANAQQLVINSITHCQQQQSDSMALQHIHSANTRMHAWSYLQVEGMPGMQGPWSSSTKQAKSARRLLIILGWKFPGTPRPWQG